MVRMLTIVASLFVAISSNADDAYLACPSEGALKSSGNAKLPLLQSLSQFDGPYSYQPKSQLIYRPTGEAEQVLVDGNVYDFRESLDAKSIYYSRVGAGNRCNIYRLKLSDRSTEKLTEAASGEWNINPVETPIGVSFLSNRDGWVSPKEGYRAFTIYAMQRDGSNQRRTWHAGLGGVFALSLGGDGWIYGASGENQGFRPGQGNGWSIWKWTPDGSLFDPVFSQLPLSKNIADWPGTTTLGWKFLVRYYDTVTGGPLLAFPPIDKGLFSAPPTHFGDPLPANNSPVRDGFIRGSIKAAYRRWGWQPYDVRNVTPQTTENDFESVNDKGEKVGVFTMPAAIPGNGVYITWSGNKGNALANWGIYEIPNIANTVEHFSELVKVVDEPERHEWLGRKIASFAEVYGHEASNPQGQKSDRLPLGSPYTTIGAPSTTHEWVTRDLPNTRIKMAADEAEYLQVILANPNMYDGQAGVERIRKNGGNGSQRTGNRNGFHSHINERLSPYDQLVPIKKYRGPNGELHMGPNPPKGYERILREDQTPDTSWQVDIPADQPYLLCFLDAERRLIANSISETWRASHSQVWTNCRGCHAHNEPDNFPFTRTFAATDEYLAKALKRLDHATPVVYERDIQPTMPHVPQRPWAIEGGPRAYGNNIVELFGTPEMTDAQKRKLNAWQMTGFLAAGRRTMGGRLVTIAPESNRGPYADTMDPTLVVRETDSATIVGAMDPQSGLKSVTVNGEAITLDEQGVWTGPKAETLVVVAIDNHNNEASYVAMEPGLSLQNEVAPPARPVAVVEKKRTLIAPR
jgi:hypothetical protein